MGKLKSKILGEKQEFEMLPPHLLSRALDKFLVSSDILDLLESVTLLSVGIETYVKSFLHNSDSNLILRLDWNRWTNIKLLFTSVHSAKQKRTIIKQRLSGMSDLTRTLDYGLALEVIPYYVRIPSNIIDDLNEFKEYRNGLFHWKAHDESAYGLTKRAIRVFDWLFKFIERKNKWWLGGDFNFIDPDGSKRKKFKQLKGSIRSENILNVQRRIFKHNFQYTYHLQTIARLNGTISIPEAITFKQSCPACHYPEMMLYEGGPIKDGKRVNRKIYARCNRCDFACSNKEFNVLKPKEMDTLNTIFDKLKRT